MKITLHRIWVEILISGLVSLFFGIAVFAFPSIPLSSFIWVFAIYMFIKGFFLSVGAMLTKSSESYWHFLFGYGILNIITGVVAARYPDITIVILGFIVSINLLLSGMLQLIVAFHLRKEVKGDAWLVVSGVIALMAGAYIYFIPRISTKDIFLLIAIAAIVVSIFLISLAIAAKKWHTGSYSVAQKTPA
jgi:uncharacterized membrane protein HdeD (DUF308 family)